MRINNLYAKEFLFVCIGVSIAATIGFIPFIFMRLCV